MLEHEVKDKLGNIYKRRHELDKETNGQTIEALTLLQKLGLAQFEKIENEWKRASGEAMPKHIRNKSSGNFKEQIKPINDVAKMIIQEYENQRQATLNGWGDSGPITCLEKCAHEKQKRSEGAAITNGSSKENEQNCIRYASQLWGQEKNIGMGEMKRILSNKFNVCESSAYTYIKRGNATGELVIPNEARRPGRPRKE